MRILGRKTRLLFGEAGSGCRYLIIFFAVGRVDSLQNWSGLERDAEGESLHGVHDRTSLAREASSQNL